MLKDINKDLENLSHDLSVSIRNYDLASKSGKDLYSNNPASNYGYGSDREYQDFGSQYSNPTKNINSYGRHNKKNVKEKETNTSYYQDKLKDNEYSKQYEIAMKQSYNSNMYNYKINNNNQNKNNHLRTIEDLYRHNKQPVIYNKQETYNKRRTTNPNFRKTNYERDSDHYISGKYLN
jgi:hypothetical protein